MPLDKTVRRRVIGALFLVGALGMLVAGESVLKTRLSALAFLLYWLICLGLTIGAIIVACLDARAMQRRTRDEQRELLESTLKNIEDESRNRAKRGS